MKELLLKEKIYFREVLHLYESDYRMEMIAKDLYIWHIFTDPEEAADLLFRAPTAKERRIGYPGVPRGYKAILYESDDTEEPRYLLVKVMTARLEGLKQECPQMIEFPFIEDDEGSHSDIVKQDMEMQVAQDGLPMDERLIAIPLDEVLADEDPRAEEKARLYAEPKPESLFGKIIPPRKLSDKMETRVKLLEMKEEDLIHVELSSEMVQLLTEGGPEGILLHRDLETINQLLETPMSEIPEVIEDPVLKPFRALLVHDREGHEVLCPAIAPGHLYISNGSEDSIEELYASLLTKDVEYLLSLGCYYGTPFIYIPTVFSLPRDV